jgi:DNA polymerase/3'-5' exonuclease PolX
MMADNHEIVKALQLYASLAELHEENPFKYKAFASGAFNLRKIKEPLGDLQESQLLSIPGVGKSVAKAIVEYSDSRAFPARYYTRWIDCHVGCERSRAQKSAANMARIGYRNGGGFV